MSVYKELLMFVFLLNPPEGRGQSQVFIVKSPVINTGVLIPLPQSGRAYIFICQIMARMRLEMEMFPVLKMVEREREMAQHPLPRSAVKNLYPSILVFCFYC